MGLGEEKVATQAEFFPGSFLIPWTYMFRVSYSSCKSTVVKGNLLEARQRVLAATPRQGERCFGHQKTHETVPAAPRRFSIPAHSAGRAQTFLRSNPSSGVGQSCQGCALGNGAARPDLGPSAPLEACSS